MNLISVVMVPGTPGHNQYIDLVMRSIAAIDSVRIRGLTPPRALLKNPLKFFRDNKCDVMIINWHENRLRATSGRLSIVGLFSYFGMLFLYRVLCQKMIYVRHNIYPHDMHGLHAFLAQKITDYGEKISDLKVAHDPSMQAAGYSYTPHPLYELSKDVVSKNNENNYALIFGSISQYKKIEEILIRWQGPLQLIIAGPCNNTNYLDYLKGIAKNNNAVKIKEGYLNDEEAYNLVINSSYTILSHNEKNMIVSGSFFFSISHGIPVFAIRSGFLNWTLNHESFPGLHLFDNYDELINSSQKLVSNRKLNNKIITKANILYGESAVRNYWGKLIK